MSGTWVPFRDRERMIELAHDGIRGETDKALLFDFGDQEAWIPRSQIRNQGDNTVTVPEWLAVEKGLV